MAISLENKRGRIINLFVEKNLGQETGKAMIY